jgi:hypothetical protein
MPLFDGLGWLLHHNSFNALELLIHKELHLWDGFSLQMSKMPLKWYWLNHQTNSLPHSKPSVKGYLPTDPIEEKAKNTSHSLGAEDNPAF